MTIILPKPTITRRMRRRLMAIAILADIIQISVLPLLLPGLAIDDAIDFIVAIIMIATVGFHWRFMLVFLLELVPYVGVFPTWALVVLSLPVADDAALPAGAAAAAPPVVRVPPVVNAAAVPADGQTIEGQIEEP